MKPRASSSGHLSYACLVLFIASAAFPVAASLMAAGTIPLWLGALDVAIAAILVGVAGVVTVQNRDRASDEDRVAAFHATSVVSSLIPVLLALFFLAGDRINWNVLVIGLAWRGWLLMYTLPYLIAAQRATPLPRTP